MGTLGLRGYGVVCVGFAWLASGCSAAEESRATGQEPTAAVAQAVVPGFDVRFRLTSVTPGGIASASGGIIDTGPMVTRLDGVRFPPNPVFTKFFSCGAPGDASCAFFDQPQFYPDPAVSPSICPLGSLPSGKCALFPDIFFEPSYLRQTRFAPTGATTVPLKVTFTGMGYFTGTPATPDASITLDVNLTAGTATPVLPTGDPVITNIVGNCAIVQNGAMPESKICFAVDVNPRTCGNAGTDTTCDSIDDDCDLAVDEDPFPTGATCGVGACTAVEMTTCGGSPTCTPLPAAMDDSSCDGIDSDCDGTVDEDCDTDGDGLLDSWETTGIDFDNDGCIDINLSARGANPAQKDIFVELDSFACTAGGDCAPMDMHSHRPAAATFTDVVNVFAFNGINLHLEIDEDLPHQQTCDFNAMGCFDTVKAAAFGTPAERAGAPCGSPKAAVLAAKAQAFHYALFAHSLPGGESGIGEQPGNDFMVTLGGFGPIPANVATGTPTQQAGTFMHELGHNLDLGHGGTDAVNFKPNYLSVMNYSFQMDGIPFIPASGLPNRFDYSPSVLPTLLEVGGPVPNLDENAGVGDGLAQTSFSCPNGVFTRGPASGGIDWNCVDANGDFTQANESGFTSDINLDRVCVGSGVNQKLETAPGGDDFLFGGLILPGPDGKLQTAFVSGRAGDDVDTGTQILPGTNGLLETPVLMWDVQVGQTIQPGPDGVLDSAVVSPGLPPLPADDFFNVMLNQIEPGFGGDNIMQTKPLMGSDDQLVGVTIGDGGNRTCESAVPMGVDDPQIRMPGDVQVTALAGPQDWGPNLKLPLKGHGNFADGVRLAVPKESMTPALAREISQHSVVADVSVTVTTATVTAAQGTEIHYQLTLSNSGPKNALQPNANLKLPAGFVVKSCTASSGGSCVTGGDLGAAGFATLAAGASVQVEFVAVAGCGFVGSAVAIAQVSTASTDPVSANNRASVTTTIVPAAPVFTRIPETLNTSQCQGVALGTARATNLCGGTVTITNNAPAKFPLGRTVVTWTAANGLGATTTATQVVNTSLGDDPACCPAGLVVRLGTPNADVITGTSASECIIGRGGQDTLSGGGGDDVISGGEGNDTINGGDGADRIFGGNGQDNLTGGNGNDQLDGGGGDDTVSGGANNDTVSGGQGQDQLFGDDGDDSLFGNDGADTLNGGNGNDQLDGGAATDSCTGGSGTNRFVSCETRPDAPGAVDGCANGVLDGLETALDCGGVSCNSCGAGLACAASSDCIGMVCAAGVCLAPASPIVATLTVTTDWGAGYCATINARNVGTTPSTDFSVRVDVKATSINQTFHGTFTPATGEVQATPSAGYKVIAPGATNSDVSFCATRPSGNTQVPEIVSSSGTF